MNKIETIVIRQSVKKERIILARESRGLLQGELAKAVGVSQGKISKMEGGFLDVSEENLNRLSKTLGYPREFFLEFTEIYPLGLNYYRKNIKIPVRLFKSIEAFVNLRRSEIEKLLQSVDMDFERATPYCDIEDEKYGTPEIIARSLRKFWKIPRGRIGNMTELLESAGILVIPCDFGTKEFSGVSTWTKDGIHLIFINRKMPGDRMRFTLAHELGHIVMHKLTTETMEVEAHKFASEFLMPSEDIKPQLFGLTINKLAQLKLHWKVSMSAILMKANDLGLLKDRQYRYLWYQMGKYGYKTNEPIEYNVPQEKPTLLSEMITTHLKELGFSVNELSSMLLLGEDEFKSIYSVENKDIKKPITKLRLISKNVG